MHITWKVCKTVTLPVVLCEYETSTLRKEHWLRVFGTESKRMKYEESGLNCALRNTTVCTHHKTLGEWSNKEG